MNRFRHSYPVVLAALSAAAMGCGQRTAGPSEGVMQARQAENRSPLCHSSGNGSANCTLPMTVPNQVPLQSMAIVGSRSLHVNDRAVVGSQNAVQSVVALVGGGTSAWGRIGADAVVGHVLSNGSMQLADRATLLGKMEIPQANWVRYGDASTVTVAEGYTYSTVSTSTINLLTTEWPDTSAGCSIEYLNGTNGTLPSFDPKGACSVSSSPGTYVIKQLRLQGGSSYLISKPGTYYVGALQIESGTSLALVPGVKLFVEDPQKLAGQIRQVVIGSGKTESDSKIGPYYVDSGPVNILLASTTTGAINIEAGAKIDAVVVAPLASVAVTSAEMRGAIFAGSAELHQNCTLDATWNVGVLSTPTPPIANNVPVPGLQDSPPDTQTVENVGFLSGSSCEVWPVDRNAKSYLTQGLLDTLQANGVSSAAISDLTAVVNRVSDPGFDQSDATFTTLGSTNSLVFATYTEIGSTYSKTNTTSPLTMNRWAVVDPVTKTGYDLSYQRMCRGADMTAGRCEFKTVQLTVPSPGQSTPTSEPYILLGLQDPWTRADHGWSPEYAKTAVLVAPTVRVPANISRMDLDVNLVVAARSFTADAAGTTVTVTPYTEVNVDDWVHELQAPVRPGIFVAAASSVSGFKNLLVSSGRRINRIRVEEPNAVAFNKMALNKMPLSAPTMWQYFQPVGGAADQYVLANEIQLPKIHLLDPSNASRLSQLAASNLSERGTSTTHSAAPPQYWCNPNAVGDAQGPPDYVEFYLPGEGADDPKCLNPVVAKQTSCDSFAVGGGWGQPGGTGKTVTCASLLCEPDADYGHCKTGGVDTTLTTYQYTLPVTVPALTSQPQASQPLAVFVGSGGGGETPFTIGNSPAIAGATGALATGSTQPAYTAARSVLVPLFADDTFWVYPAHSFGITDTITSSAVGLPSNYPRGLVDTSGMVVPRCDSPVRPNGNSILPYPNGGYKLDSLACEGKDYVTALSRDPVNPEWPLGTNCGGPSLLKTTLSCNQLVRVNVALGSSGTQKFQARTILNTSADISSALNRYIAETWGTSTSPGTVPVVADGSESAASTSAVIAEVITGGDFTRVLTESADIASLANSGVPTNDYAYLESVIGAAYPSSSYNALPAPGPDAKAADLNRVRLIALAQNSSAPRNVFGLKYGAHGHGLATSSWENLSPPVISGIRTQLLELSDQSLSLEAVVYEATQNRTMSALCNMASTLSSEAEALKGASSPAINQAQAAAAQIEDLSQTLNLHSAEFAKALCNAYGIPMAECELTNFPMDKLQQIVQADARGLQDSCATANIQSVISTITTVASCIPIVSNAASALNAMAIGLQSLKDGADAFDSISDTMKQLAKDENSPFNKVIENVSILKDAVPAVASGAAWFQKEVSGVSEGGDCSPTNNPNEWAALQMLAGNFAQIETTFKLIADDLTLLQIQLTTLNSILTSTTGVDKFATGLQSQMQHIANECRLPTGASLGPADLQASCRTLQSSIRSQEQLLFKLSSSLQTAAAATSSKAGLVVPARVAPATQPDYLQVLKDPRSVPYVTNVLSSRRISNTSDPLSLSSFYESARDRYNAWKNNDICQHPENEQNVKNVVRKEFVVRKVIDVASLNSVGVVNVDITLDDVIRAGKVNQAAGGIQHAGLFMQSVSGAWVHASTPIVLDANLHECSKTNPDGSCELRTATRPFHLVNLGQAQVGALPSDCTAAGRSLTAEPTMVDGPSGTGPNLVSACLLPLAVPMQAVEFFPSSTQIVDLDWIMSNLTVNCRTTQTEWSPQEFIFAGYPVIGSWALTIDSERAKALMGYPASPGPVTSVETPVVELELLVMTEPVEAEKSYFTLTASAPGQ